MWLRTTIHAFNKACLRTVQRLDLMIVLNACRSRVFVGRTLFGMFTSISATALRNLQSAVAKIVFVVFLVEELLTSSLKMGICSNKFDDICCLESMVNGKKTHQPSFLSSEKRKIKLLSFGKHNPWRTATSKLLPTKSTTIY